MDLAHIKQRVVEIEAMKHDAESTHYAEDKLRADFIALVAHQFAAPDLAAMAREVLKTDDIRFARWCA